MNAHPPDSTARQYLTAPWSGGRGHQGMAAITQQASASPTTLQQRGSASAERSMRALSTGSGPWPGVCLPMLLKLWGPEVLRLSFLRAHRCLGASLPAEYPGSLPGATERLQAIPRLLKRGPIVCSAAGSDQGQLQPEASGQALSGEASGASIPLPVSCPAGTPSCPCKAWCCACRPAVGPAPSWAHGAA